MDSLDPVHYAGAEGKALRRKGSVETACPTGRTRARLCLSCESRRQLCDRFHHGSDRREATAVNRLKGLIAVAAAGTAVAAGLSRRASPMDLKGKVVLITGGSRGLGLAV